MSLEPQTPSWHRRLALQLLNPLILGRVFFVVLVTYLGYLMRPSPDQTIIADAPTLQIHAENLFFTIGAFLVAILVVVFEYSTNIISSNNILLAAAGLLLGLVTAYFFHYVIPRSVLPEHLRPRQETQLAYPNAPDLSNVTPWTYRPPEPNSEFADPGIAPYLGNYQGAGSQPVIISETGAARARQGDIIHTVCAAIFGYFGIIIVVKHAERFRLRNLKMLLTDSGGPAFILDTSVIIDGRINEFLRLNILRGPIIVPQFVLGELQNIADSSDQQRRMRGRRGLNVLEQTRQTVPEMRIWSHDYPGIAEVDQKLIQMAKDLQATLITNDYNLEKVSQLQRIPVININELSNALRPPIQVGAELGIDIVREGKEPKQGVGYLEDGTMVVVDEGRHLVGGQADVVVTSILQTPAGRMVFSRPRRTNNHDNDAAGESGG